MPRRFSTAEEPLPEKNNSVRLFSWNVNGLRACGRKGFREWFDAEQPDDVLENSLVPHVN